jgi:hypothetical protein
MNAARYFSPDYFTARNRFREAAVRAGARLETLPLLAKGPGGVQLGIDVAWAGADPPRRLLLHSSGLHGVEGFAGSAIQLRLLEDLPSLSPGTALVVAHVLNPYGMAWLRRVNENNVDLNRNFLDDRPYSGAPPAYSMLDPFLNPKSRPGRDFYFLRAAFLIMRFGMPVLRQSVVGGQYEFPNGLFFGGKQMEEGPRLYETFLERVRSAEKAIAIDVHTGLGKFKEDTLLVASEDFVNLRNIFGTRVTPLQPEQGAYRIEGGIETMIFRAFTKTRPIVIGQEFGTCHSVRVLHALREENRWHHYGTGSPDHATKRHLKNVFCPDNEPWREAVLKRGGELLERAIAELDQ